jgi:D-glycero-alpha-D-manno-heptose-7-phosphate kinase
VSTSEIDAAVEAAVGAGATGAKVTGAGGGGFLLVVCPLERQRFVREALAHMRELPIKIDPFGSRVVLNVHHDIWS